MAKKFLFAVALAVLIAAGALWVLVPSREEPMVAKHSLPSQIVVPVLPDELRNYPVKLDSVEPRIEAPTSQHAIPNQDAAPPPTNSPARIYIDKPKGGAWADYTFSEPPVPHYTPYRSYSGSDTYIGSYYADATPPYAEATPPRCEKLGIVGSDCIDFDAILAGLENAWAGYTCPKKMRVNRETSVTLVLDPSKKPSEISEQTAKMGIATLLDAKPQQIVTKATQLTSQMSATLEGASFKIEPSESQTKTVTKAHPVTWEWRVTPSEEGDKKLTLKLYVQVGKDEENTHPIEINSMTESIDVYVTTWDQAVSLVPQANDLAGGIMGISTILLGGAAWLYRKAWLPLVTGRRNAPPNRSVTRASNKPRKPRKSPSGR